MEVILADAAGFCFGVKRALDKALQTRREHEGTPINTLGPLIHNPQVVAELKDKGIGVLEQPEDMEAGVVIVRCHGVPPKVMNQLETRGVNVVDTTCPFVRRAMRWAEQLKDEGYQVVIVGDESHPEVKAIYGASDETAWIIQSPRAIDELPSAKRIGIIAQTTQSSDNFRACVSAFIGRVEELKAFDTICTATEQRQHSARQVAAQVDVMVVIGGRNSANTKRLVEVCQESGATTYHIESADELQEEWFVDANKAGITAGASTPNWLIEEVHRRMTEEKVVETTETEEQETVTEEQANEQDNTAEETETQEAQMENFADLLPTPGKMVTGKVVQIRPEEVLVDIGYKSDGVIPARELSFRDVKPEDVVKLGDELTVEVLKVDDAEGTVILSKRRAEADQAWEKLEKIYENGETLDAKITQTVKGGLLVDVGVRGFIPASHVSRDFEENLDKYIGQTLTLKIIELDKQKNNVVFSHKEVLEEEYQKAKEEAFDKLEENSIVEGVVRRITDFGAFVDIGGGVEGLLHVSEMAYSRVNHPSDVVSEGDKIKVMVLGVDKENERISLGLKQTVADPWDSISDRYAVGDVVEGEVTRVVDFGAFVKLEDGVEGLVHISQLSHKHVAKTDDVLKPGDQVKAKVISLDPDAHRIGLSLKELEPKPEPDKPSRPKQAPKQQNKQVAEETEELTTTLGDVFGDLFKKD